MAWFQPVPWQEISYFDGSFVVGENENFNNIYQQIINLVPTKEPWLNNWYRSGFTQSMEEQWDKNRVYFRCRNGFSPCDNSWMMWEVVDSVVHEGVRYWMTITDCSEMRIYKQCQAIAEQCWSYILPDVCTWKKIKLSSWKNKRWQYVDYFPTNCCGYHKFFITDWVKWEQKWAVTDLVLSNIECWGRPFYIAYRKNWGNIGIQTWEFLSIETGWYGWQVNMAVHVDRSIVPCEIPEGAVFFLAPWEWLPTLTWSGNVVSDRDIVGIIFPEFWPTIHVATDDGIYHLPFSDCEGVAEWYSDSLTKWGDVSISSVFNYGTQWFWFIDRLSHTIFFWWEGWQTFRTDLLKRKYIGDKYTDAIWFFSYLILIWPKSLWLISDNSWQTKLHDMITDKW
jgi:hypothetical protein